MSIFHLPTVRLRLSRASLNAVAVNYLLYPSALQLSYRPYEIETFRTEVRLPPPRADQLLCPASSLPRFLYRRGSLLGPVSVFSDVTALPCRHVTERLFRIHASAGVDGNFFKQEFFRVHSASTGGVLPVQRHLPFTCVPLKLLFPRQLRSYALRHSSCCRVLSTVITVIYSLSSRPLIRPLSLSLFAGECKVSGSRSFTPRAAWSHPLFQLVS